MNRIKKISIFLLITTIISSSLLISCSNDENTSNNSDKLDLSKKVLKFDEIKLISQKVSKYQKEIVTKRIDARTAEEEMQELLEPLVENGEDLHSEMITFLQENGEFDNMTLEEQNELMNLDEQQLAELSFVMSNAYDARISIDPRIRACLSAAIGVTAIYDLISNTAALGTVETTIGALRLIGRRYLGWIGVGLMIMDFADCYYGN
jgi:hypothetical protein